MAPPLRTVAGMLAVFGPLILSTVAFAEKKLDDEGKVKLQADLRIRFESDFDSRRSDGRRRDDRNRLRARARLGMTFHPHQRLTFGFRLRTGARDSQQSPHVTLIDFDDNPKGDRDILFDKWYVRVSDERFWVWGGRNLFPFWKQNELFWDDDVTPAGVAWGFKSSQGIRSFALNGGLFGLPDGGVGFNGLLAAGQAVFSVNADKGGLTAAGGLFRFNGAHNAVHLRNGNGARDYLIWSGNLQARFRAFRQTLKLGLDLFHNGEDYSPSAADPFTAAHFDEDDGLVALVSLGELKKSRDWLVAYYYARIEALAVHASFAQDDWLRFGSATQTDSSDFKGHEFRLAYALARNWNVVARLYLVQAISSSQDGNRFRLDLNYAF